MPSCIGVFGDVHAASHRVEAALRFLRASDVDALCCVGDVVDGPGDAERCCQLLRSNNVTTVRGNHDRWFLTGQMRDLRHVTPSDALSETSLAWLCALPRTHTFETPAGSYSVTAWARTTWRD